MRKLLIGMALLSFCSLNLSAAAADWTLTPPRFWVGGQLGMNIPLSRDVDFFAPPLKGTLAGLERETAPLAGVVAGVDWGFLGFMVDLSYNPYNLPAQVGTGSILPASVAAVPVPALSGYQTAFTMLFRLQPALHPQVRPYLGAGPVLAWTTLDFSPVLGGKQTSMDVGFAAEGGLRMEFTPHWLGELGLRYRYLKSNFDFGAAVTRVQAAGETSSVQLLARVAYRF